MRGQARRNAILQALARHGSVKVGDLVQLTASSAVSIRRDLAALEDEGVVQRVHGGAVLASSPNRLSPRREPGRDEKTLPVIGLVVPASGYYFASALDGIRDAARDAGVRIVLAVSEYSGARERRQIARLVELGASGLIVTPSSTIDTDSATFTDLAAARVPVVVMEREVNDGLRRLDLVRSDHGAGALEAFTVLAEHHHRGTALISLVQTPTIRHLGEGLRRAGGLFDPEKVKVLQFTESASDEDDGAERFLERALDQCIAAGITSAVVHTDVAAIEFAQVLRARGLDIPRDFSLIAYDDEVAAMADPPLDAVRPPKFEVGRQAVLLLLDRMAGAGTAAPRHITLIPELISRGSTARHG